MRALAVLVVVLCHAGVPGFAGGFVGVDLFFVISGYLICGILARELAAGEFSLVGFYERRVRRILPPLFLVIVTCFAVGWWLLPPPAYADLAHSAIPATLFWSNLHFRASTADYFAPDAGFEPLLHTWSLAVEEQFYLAVPLAMWLAWRIDRRLLLPAALLASLASFGWSLRVMAATPDSAFFLIQTRAWELGAGAVLALLPERWRAPAWLAEAGAVAGMAAILFAVTSYDGDTAFPGLAAVPPVLGGAALIWAGTQRSTVVGRVLSLAPLVWVGLISYALYLWHWPALALARHLYVSVELPLHVALLAVAAAGVLAVLSTVLVERPLRWRGPQAVLPRGPLFAVAAAAAVAIIGFASLAERHEGFWSRAPAARAIVEEAEPRPELGERCRLRWRELREPCELGAVLASGAVPQVLLWGDSHAAALLPGLDAVLRERGIAGAATVASACPPLPGIDRRTRGEARHCSAINAQVLALLDSQPDAFGTVVLSARWVGSVSQTTAPGEWRQRDPLIDATTGEQVPRARAPAVVEERLSALARLLVASGRRVIVVGGIPEPGSDVPQHYLAAQFGSPVPFAPRTVSSVRQREAPVDAILARLAQIPGVTVIDPVAAWCGQTCPKEYDGHLLYRDTNHLSTFGSRLLVPLMFEQVEL